MAAAVMPDAAAGGAGVAGPYHYHHQQQQGVVSLLAWFEGARGVVVQQLQEGLVIAVPTYSVDIGSMLASVVGLARLVVQVHNLLCRGALPEHEQRALGL